MNKELEALKELDWLYNQGFEVTGWHLNGDLEPLNNFLDNFYEPVKQALTPPTQEEVCEALSEWLSEEVVIDERFNNTIFKIKRGSNIAYMSGYNIQINQGLPPHLITLIGRFYEAQDNE